MIGTRQRQSTAAVVVTVAAVVLGLAGIAITAAGLRSEARDRRILVRALDAAELPAGIPAALEPDASAAVPVVGMLDSLRHMDRKPREVGWFHFRCVEAATVLTAEPRGDLRAFRAGLVDAFPPSWTRTVGKDADFIRSPDGRVEVAIPESGGRDAVDELAASLCPERVVALAYRLRPC